MTVILVVSMIIIFLAIDFVYQKSSKRTSTATSPVSLKSKTAAKYSANEIMVPKYVFFGKGHTWVGLKQSGNVQIGIDDFVRRFLGSFERISIKGIGEEIQKGEVLFSIERDGKKLNFASPVSGTVYSHNDDASEKFRSTETNPYENWLLTVKPKNLSFELKLMKIADEAASWIKQEMTRLKDFAAGLSVENSLVGATLQDGGLPVNGLMEYIDNNSIDRFEKEFLSE
jgi:glycine cleavage system H protein